MKPELYLTQLAHDRRQALAGAAEAYRLSRLARGLPPRRGQPGRDHGDRGRPSQAADCAYGG